MMDISAHSNAAAFLSKIVDTPPMASGSAAHKPRPASAAAPAAGQKPGATEPSLEQVKQAVQDINKSLKSLAQGLEFSVNTDTRQTVVKVIDRQTQEVIRQMPSEQALQIAKALDQVLGKLLSEKA